MGQLLTHDRRESKTAGAMATPLDELRGASRPMVGLRTEVVRLLAHQQGARRLPPVLILGETGTGKGLLARCIHQAGPRREGPFVAVNCAAIPETLLEAELFGYERGAFTDARQAKPGLFQTAHSGTLFLDEIGLLPGAVQGKLLTVLEDRAVRRLGGTRTESVDVAVVAATSATSTGSARVLPSRRTARSSSTMNSLPCRARKNRPISSRNSVPPWAIWKRPGLACRASVKAPRS